MKEYFQHDYNARTDLKIAALIEDHGAAGYGLYWCVVELMHGSQTAELQTDKTTIRGVAIQMRMKPDKVEQIVNAMIDDYQLFARTDTGITSNRVQLNLEKRNAVRQQRAEAGRIGGKKSKSKQTQAVASDDQAKESKEKESKGKEIKENKQEARDTFSEFWDHYHNTTGRKRMNKEAAFKHWDKLSQKERQLAKDSVQAYVDQADVKDPQYYKLARTYLKERVWDDFDGSVNKPNYDNIVPKWGN